MSKIDNSRSILKDIKLMLNIAEDNTDFDTMLIIYINSAFAALRQIGVGPSTGFNIEDDTAKWTDFLGTTDKLSNQVKTYIAMKVRLVFDTPQASGMKEAMERELAEQEYRLQLLWEVEK